MRCGGARLPRSNYAKAAIQRIERLNSRLCAFLTVTADSALTRAREAEAELAAGRDRGPLHGIPIAVKDLFYTRGVRTTGGSKIFEDFVPDYDAAVVEKLEAAGAVMLGKLNMHELAYGITSANPHFGPVRNPWNPEYSPGGSSGGSGAAVAAGMVYAAMGSDTGGSIRIPASFCGVVGLKPTYGRVSRYGTMPLGYSLDHMGPLTRSARDAALVLNAIAGYDARDPASSRHPVVDFVPDEECSIRGLRVGFPENFLFERLDPDVESAVRGAVARAGSLGAVVKPVKIRPDPEAMNAIARTVLLGEAAATLQPYLGNREKFGADVLALLDQGQAAAGQRLHQRPARAPRNVPRVRRGVERSGLHRGAGHAQHGAAGGADDGETRRAGRRRAAGDDTAGAMGEPAGPAGAVDALRVERRGAAGGAANHWAAVRRSGGAAGGGRPGRRGRGNSARAVDLRQRSCFAKTL